MARIAKSEHEKIHRLVDVEKRKVAEVAAEYGCSPANIYTILAKFRREDDMTTALEDATPKMPLPEEETLEATADTEADKLPVTGVPSGPDLFTTTTGLPDAALAAQSPKAITRSQEKRASVTGAATVARN